jgi:hypothetical protein
MGGRGLSAMATPDWYRALADAEADARLAYALLHPDRTSPSQLAEVPIDPAQLRYYITSLRARLDHLSAELERALYAQRAELAAEHSVAPRAAPDPFVRYLDRRI